MAENSGVPGVSRVCPGYTQTHLSGGGVPNIPLGGLGSTTHGPKNTYWRGLQVYPGRLDTPGHTG